MVSLLTCALLAHTYLLLSWSFCFSIFWKLKSCKCERIKSQLDDWIVSCSVSGCIKRPSLRMYKMVMDASSLHLDCSKLTSAEGRKKRAGLIYWAGQLKEKRGWMTDSPPSSSVIFLHICLRLEESKSCRNYNIHPCKSRDLQISYQPHFISQSSFPVCSFSAL